MCSCLSMVDDYDTLKVPEVEPIDFTAPTIHMPNMSRYSERGWEFRLFGYVSSIPPREDLVAANLMLLKGDAWDGATAPISLIDIAKRDGPEGCRHQVGSMFFRDIAFQFSLAEGNIGALDSFSTLRRGYVPGMLVFYHNGALQKTAIGDTNLQMNALQKSTLGVVPGVVLTGERGERYRGTYAEADLEFAFSVLQPTFSRYSAQLDEHINRIAAGFVRR